MLVDELKIDARVVRQRGVAPTEDDRPDEQGHLVDQPGDESLCCEVRATDQQIRSGLSFQVAYRAGIEVAFDPMTSCCGRSLLPAALLADGCFSEATAGPIRLGAPAVGSLR